MKLWLPSKVRRNIKLCPETGCWLWQGDKSRNGYGRMYYRNFRYMAHKMVYGLYCGDWLDDNKKQLDHLCEVRNCVNPRHMEKVTQEVNLKRRFGNRRKHPPIKEKIYV
jgi:hypothetical protein